MFLKMQLPSRRCISYPFAREGEGKYGDAVVIFKDAQQGQFKDCNHGAGFWGGSLVENAVQGIGRDILMDAVVRLEEAGYPVILTIHDEVICEVPENFGSLGEFKALVAQRPTWAPELPIAVKLRVGPRLANIDLPVKTGKPGSLDTVPLYTAQHKPKPQRSERPPKPTTPKVAAPKPARPPRARPVSDDQPVERRQLTPAERAARYVDFVRHENTRVEHVLELAQLDKEDPEKATRLRACDDEWLARAQAWDGQGDAPPKPIIAAAAAAPGALPVIAGTMVASEAADTMQITVTVSPPLAPDIPPELLAAIDADMAAAKPSETPADQADESQSSSSRVPPGGSKTATEGDTHAHDHDGEPFNDSYLLRRGYSCTRTFNYTLPDGTLLYEQHSRAQGTAA